MLTTAIALLMAAQAPQTTGGDTLSASQILTKMFARYASAQSVSGNIKMVQTITGDPKVMQTAKNGTIEADSQLQFDRPTKIFLHQTRSGTKGGEWYLTSDGKEFSYDRPNQTGDIIYGRRRYVELVTQHGVNLTIANFLGAASHSLGDINPMIEAAIADPDRLKRLVAQWASLEYRGRFSVNGQMVQGMSGQYRDSPTAPINGNFEAYVSDAGDFVRFVLIQKFSYPKVSPEPFEVKTTWNSDIALNVKTDPGLYKVIAQ